MVEVWNQGKILAKNESIQRLADGVSGATFVLYELVVAELVVAAPQTFWRLEIDLSVGNHWVLMWNAPHRLLIR